MMARRRSKAACSAKTILLGLVLATVCGLVFLHSHALRPVAAPPSATVAAAPAAAAPAPAAVAPAEPAAPAAPRRADSKPPPPPPSPPRGSGTILKPGESEVHVVFSTDCSGYQHWQSIALWYSSRMAGQRGPVTRIASGCEASQRAAIETEWREIDETGEFRAHFAPKGELKGNYKYSNKPSGLYHWLTTAQPPPFRDWSRGVVVLLDPDQFMLRPITAAVAAGLDGGPEAKFLYDGDGVPRVIGDGARNVHGFAAAVAPGRPVAQEYGIGGAWGAAGTDRARPSWKTFDRARVCGADGACTRTDEQEANAHYSVGPPYLIHARDATALAKAWLEAVPHVHAQYPHLLAEMYAYSMAAANLSLPHDQVHHLMVSNTGAGGEGWNWVDHASATMCDGAGLATPPSDTAFDVSAAFDNDKHAPGPAAPAVLHFCQSYRAGGHKFGKHSVPHSIFSCESGVFTFDPAKVAAAAAAPDAPKATVRSAYFLCNILPRLNAAMLEYKRTVCPKRGGLSWNEAPSVHG